MEPKEATHMTIIKDGDDTCTRRAFVAATASGYALAVLPITALAIQTPATDLETADVKIALGKETMPGYSARPKKAGAHPVVIVVHEIFGVHEYIKDVCRRLANEGYYAIAPDLYFRQGDATKIEDREKLRKDIVNKVSHPQVLADLDATLAWLAKDTNADTKRAGITGFCWGGNIVWMYAAHNPGLKAGAAWYGRLTGDPSELQPKFPVDVADKLTVPVIGLYGEKDQGIPLEQVDKMKAALAKGKSGSKIVVYAGAEHGFHADYRPSYNEKAAKEAWSEMLTWFKKNNL
jgi:carboxymethylenebutenolidase